MLLLTQTLAVPYSHPHPPLPQRLPCGVVLRHRLLPRRLAGGRAPSGVQGVGRGAAGGEGGAAGGAGLSLCCVLVACISLYRTHAMHFDLLNISFM